MSVVMAQNLNYGTYYSSPNNAGSKTQRLVIVGIIIAVVLGGALLVFSMLNGNNQNDLTLLAVRESSLLTLTNATTTTTNIRNQDLATANSNASILLLSDVTSMLKVTGQKALPSDLIKKEADTNGDTLKNAALLDKFDSTYKQIVVQKVEALISEAQTLRGLNKSSQNVVNQAIINLQAIDKQFTQQQL